METSNFYTLRITFHPDPKVEYKKKFSNRQEAQKHIDDIGKEGEYWMIVKESDGTYDLARGFKYQKNT